MTEQSRKAAKGSAPAKRRESAAERADRNMGELLQELRVALPGVQVLFAFLLTVPFAQGFVTLTDGQRDLYFGVLMSTAIATAFLIAPTPLHRGLFQLRDKEYLVSVANKLTIIGLGVLAISITGAVLLIADILFDGIRVVIYPGVIGLLLLGLWALLPLYRRSRLDDQGR
jgi:Family of unknown function (DUF6328)